MNTARPKHSAHACNASRGRPALSIRESENQLLVAAPAEPAADVCRRGTASMLDSYGGRSPRAARERRPAAPVPPTCGYSSLPSVAAYRRRGSDRTRSARAFFLRALFKTQERARLRQRVGGSLPASPSHAQTRRSVARSSIFTATSCRMGGKSPHGGSHHSTTQLWQAFRLPHAARPVRRKNARAERVRLRAPREVRR